ncbi:putative beta-1,4-xylosyltransferase IRX10L-like [Capsicum annuum]|nr:putative beta-1,4-xylosyltransferase IRX10L-like [Capsicum annuum]
MRKAIKISRRDDERRQKKLADEVVGVSTSFAPTMGPSSDPTQVEIPPILEDNIVSTPTTIGVYFATGKANVVVEALNRLPMGSLSHVDMDKRELVKDIYHLANLGVYLFLPWSKNLCDSIWGIVDRMTKSAHFLPVRTNFSAKDYAKLFLQEVVKLHGGPGEDLGLASSSVVDEGRGFGKGKIDILASLFSNFAKGKSRDVWSPIMLVNVLSHYSRMNDPKGTIVLSPKMINNGYGMLYAYKWDWYDDTNGMPLRLCWITVDLGGLVGYLMTDGCLVTDGHIALKSFDAEVVDEAGYSVPLHETYLHHWVVLRYYHRKGVDVAKYHGNLGFHKSDFTIKRNSGICDGGLSQYFGLGSETRKTITYVPDPYGIEVGNLVEVPPGYEERWMLNVHSIDTRGAEDRLGCTECRCDLHNVSKDEYDRVIEPDYIGGLRCCYDETRCRVKDGFQGSRRSLYLKYTVKYIDWDASILPVKIYILDVTDTWKRPGKSIATVARHHCLIKYLVESCPASVSNVDCSHTKKITVTFPSGGDIIYRVAHQHTGGTGMALHGEDGRVICSSLPIYGEGKEPGNEAGYIVGMSSCYPRPGSMKISEGEMVTLLSNYSNAQRHTGVMGLFYLLVADHQQSLIRSYIPQIEFPELVSSSLIQTGEIVILHNAIGALAVFGIALLVGAVVIYQCRNQREEGYEPILM